MARKKKGEAGEENIRIDGPMTIYEVADIHESLVQSMGGGKDVQIDLQGVTDCDASGIQLLYSAFETIEEKGLKISLINLSESIRNMADQMGIEIAACAGIEGG